MRIIFYSSEKQPGQGVMPRPLSAALKRDEGQRVRACDSAMRRALILQLRLRQHQRPPAALEWTTAKHAGGRLERAHQR